MPSFRVFLSHSIIFVIQNKKYKHIDDVEGIKERKDIKWKSLVLIFSTMYKKKLRQGTQKKGGKSEKFQVN